MKKILLFGGTGLVGKNFLQCKFADRYEINSPTKQEVNLLDESRTVEFIQDSHPDLIINAAGKVGGIKANICNDLDFYLDNLSIGTNILLGARKSKVKNVLNLGSSCMYPANTNKKLKETDLMKGELEKTNEGYALAKLAVSKLAEYMSNQEPDLNYKTIIPCNLFGKFDNFDPITSHMIPSVISKVHNAKLNDELNVEMWGDGSVKREFMYIEDFIDFLYFSIKNFERLPQYINVGTQTDYSIKHYYKIIMKVIGFKGNIVKNTAQPTGMLRKKVDTTLLTEFGWKSKITLEQGIKETYNFYLKEIHEKI